MAEPDLSELEDIRKFVLESLPAGFHLDSLELTVSTLFEGQRPAFTVLITLSEDGDAEGYGLGYEISSRIRERWSRDDLYIKIHFAHTAA